MPEFRARMKAAKRRDTGPEIALRSLLYGMGLRYRVDYRALPGERFRVDIAFTRKKVAVFVDGCFWHACPEHGSWPVRNESWWREKLRANVARDARATAALTADGWAVLRVWEHEEAPAAAAKVMSLLDSRP